MLKRSYDRKITDIFKRFITLPSKRPSPSNGADEPPATRQRSSSLTPLPTQEPSPHLSSGSEHTIGPETQCHESLPAPKVSGLPHNHNTEEPRQNGSFEPLLTQTSTVPSSQRVVKNGEVHIRNSDDELGSDASSLEDLDDILYLRQAPSPTPEPQPLDLPSEVMEEKPQRKVLPRKPQAEPSSIIVKPTPRVSFQALAKQKKEYEASKLDISRTRDLLEDQAVKEMRRKIVDADLVDKLIQDRGDDDDDLDRLKTAMRRTEALHYDDSWSFFDASIPAVGHSELHIDNGNDLATLLSDAPTRQQTFLSGFVEDYAKKDCLPDELLYWILDTACWEPRSDLRRAYTDVLIAASEQMADILDVDCLQKLFKQIGASEAALRPETPVEPRAVFSEDLQSNKRIDLLWLIDMLNALAAFLTDETQIHAICLLCRLLLDQSIINNHCILLEVETALAALLTHTCDQPSEPSVHHLSQIRTLLANLFNSATKPALRVQLLRNLPLISPHWFFLRRQLALSWFFSDSSYIDYPNQTPFSLSEISNHLSTPTFTLNNSTDYALLTSSIQILDIALDSADRPASNDSNISPEEEKSFNDAIDALAARIKGMFMQIIDSGASNMRRTEAKEVLEGVHSRLLYSVRTRPPRKKNIFGGEAEEYLGERRGMQEYLEAVKIGKANAHEGVVDGVS